MKTNEFDTQGIELIRTISASTNSNNAMINAGKSPADVPHQPSEDAQALIDDLFSMS